MKSLLKFLLLFSLIVVGKLTKEPVAEDIATKEVANELPVHLVSFFSRQATLQGAGAGDDKLWLQDQATATNNRNKYMISN